MVIPTAATSGWMPPAAGVGERQDPIFRLWARTSNWALVLGSVMISTAVDLQSSVPRWCCLYSKELEPAPASLQATCVSPGQLQLYFHLCGPRLSALQLSPLLGGDHGVFPS